MHFVHIYFAFAAGYLLSYLYRTVNAVISPELARELALSPASLGLLTSAYFLAFAAMQLPAGILLDRYGPRRVEPVLLAVAAAGAALFACCRDAAGPRGRARAHRRRRLRVPDGAAEGDRRVVSARPAGVVRRAGSWSPAASARSSATTPIEFALRVAHWRVVFVGPCRS